MPIEHMLCYFCNKQCIKAFRRAKSVDFLVLYSKEKIHNNTTPTFKKWVG